MKLRLKLGFPPRFLVINFTKYHKLDQTRQLKVKELITQINQLHLNQLEFKSNQLTQTYQSLSRPNSQLPDSPNNYVRNHSEWTDINNYIKFNPLRSKPTLKYRTNNDQLTTLKTGIGYLGPCLLDSLKPILNELNNIHHTTPEIKNQIPTYADKDKVYKIQDQTGGIYLIQNTKKPFETPPYVLKALSFGLNFVPDHRSYPTDSIKENFAEFEHRLRWKFFWNRATSTAPDPNKKENFLPLSLRKSLRTNPPDNKILTNFVNNIQTEFTKRIDDSNKKIKLPSKSRQLALAINSTIKFFRSNIDQLILKPADKGSGTVIIDKDFYINGVEQYIHSNIDFFKQINFDPTLKLLDLINKELKILKNLRLIDYKTLQILTPDQNSARCPYLYGLPKIHKHPISFRPIVSGNGHPTEKLSIFIDFLLQPYAIQNPYYLKDSTDLINQLQSIGKLDPNSTILFSLDVVNMYTNIPLNELIHSILTTIQAHPIDMLKVKYTQYSPNLVKKLLELTLFNNYFQFNGKFYHQKHGIAMGTPCACSTSDIFICNWINSALTKLKSDPNLNSTPLFYKQYRDDGFGIWTHGIDKLEKFVSYLNTLHTTLKFTLTHGSSISYLDLNLSINQHGQVTTDTYYKPTDTFAYLHASSNHPKHCLNNIGLSQSIRHIRNCSNYSTYTYHSHFLKYNLTQKGHNYHMVSNKIRKLRYRNRAALLKYSNPKRLTRTPLIVTHNRNMPDLKKIVKNVTNKTLDADYLSAIGGIPIIGYRIQKSIGAAIIRAKS